MSIKHQELFVKFSETFSPETVERWEAAVNAWDADEDVPNPYEEPVNGISLCLMFPMLLLSNLV